MPPITKVHYIYRCGCVEHVIFEDPAMSENSLLPMLSTTNNTTSSSSSNNSSSEDLIALIRQSSLMNSPPAPIGIEVYKRDRGSTCKEMERLTTTPIVRELDAEMVKPRTLQTTTVTFLEHEDCHDCWSVTPSQAAAGETSFRTVDAAESIDPFKIWRERQVSMPEEELGSERLSKHRVPLAEISVNAATARRLVQRHSSV